MSLYSRLKLASSLSGTASSGTEPRALESATMRTSAVATDNSEEGYVTVEFEDGTEMEVPTLTSVDAGDEVQVLVDGDDAIALGSGGWGDDMSDATMEAYSIGEAAQTIAEEAQAVAEATNQHFWADDNGIHVSSDESDDEGERNVLINSLGLLFRRFGSYLATLTASAISFWDGTGNDGSHILAFLGKDGSRIGDAEKANTIITDSGFSVRTGDEQRISMGVAYRESPNSGGRFRVRKVGKVYKAGYSDPENMYIDPMLNGHVTNVPLTDPGARLFFGNYDREYDEYVVSDGQVAGVQFPLISIDELISTSGTYLSYGDVTEEMEGHYSKEVVPYAQGGTADYFISFEGPNVLSSYLMEFDDVALAAIPQDTWDDAAIAHGSPNWFIGTVYEDGDPFATMDGEAFAMRSELSGYATQSDIADMATEAYVDGKLAHYAGPASITRYLNTNYTCTASDVQLADLNQTLGEYDPHNVLSVSGGNIIVEAGYVVEVSASGIVMGTTSHGNAALSIYKGTGTALTSKSVLAQAFAGFPLSSSKNMSVSIAPIVVQCTAKTYFALAARSTSAGATVSSGSSGTSATSIPTTMLNVRVIGKI